MFGSSGASELGYANSALLIALLRELVAAKVLTPEGVKDVLDDGVDILGSAQTVASVSAGIRIIREGIGPRVEGL
jgi:hypothetical protein